MYDIICNIANLIASGTSVLFAPYPATYTIFNPFATLKPEGHASPSRKKTLAGSLALSKKYLDEENVVSVSWSLKLLTDDTEETPTVTPEPV